MTTGLLSSRDHARGVLKKELLAHLRSRRIMRRGKTSSTGDQTRAQIIDAISIRDRPAEIENRGIPGHWEGDLRGTQPLRALPYKAR